MVRERIRGQASAHIEIPRRPAGMARAAGLDLAASSRRRARMCTVPRAPGVPNRPREPSILATATAASASRGSWPPRCATPRRGDTGERLDLGIAVPGRGPRRSGVGGTCHVSEVAAHRGGCPRDRLGASPRPRAGAHRTPHQPRTPPGPAHPRSRPPPGSPPPAFPRHAVVPVQPPRGLHPGPSTPDSTKPGVVAQGGAHTGRRRGDSGSGVEPISSGSGPPCTGRPRRRRGTRPAPWSAR